MINIMPKRTYYYSDPLNDDFANTNIKTKSLPKNYKYINKNIFYQILEALLRIIVFPIVYLILKIEYLFKIKNKKVLKQSKNKGYFIYGNHTSYLLDAYLPTLVNPFKRPYIIVNPDALSIKGLRTIVKLLGALPTPSNSKEARGFISAINEYINKNKVIAIYPEAHIWPFYYDIRPFDSVSFHYPYDFDSNVYSMTTIYKKRKLSFIKRPKAVIYIDGPFKVNKELPKKEAIIDLRNQVYNSMKKRVLENPQYKYYEYIYTNKDIK